MKSSWFRRSRIFAIFPALIALALIIACGGTAAPEQQETTAAPAQPPAVEQKGRSKSHSPRRHSPSPRHSSTYRTTIRRIRPTATRCTHRCADRHSD